MQGHPNLKGWFRFQGDGRDSSGGSTSLSALNGASYTAGIFGQGGDLTTGTGAVFKDASISIPGGSKYTVAVTIDPSDIGTNISHLMYGNGIARAVALYALKGTPNTIQATFQESVGANQAVKIVQYPWVTGTKLRLVGVYDASLATAVERVKIYVNGIEITTGQTTPQTGNATLGTFDNKLMIGNYDDNTNTYKCRFVDEAIIFPGLALSPSDVKRVTQGLPPLYRS